MIGAMNVEDYNVKSGYPGMPGDEDYLKSSIRITIVHNLTAQGHGPSLSDKLVRLYSESMKRSNTCKESIPNRTSLKLVYE